MQPCAFRHFAFAASHGFADFGLQLLDSAVFVDVVGVDVQVFLDVLGQFLHVGFLAGFVGCAWHHAQDSAAEFGVVKRPFRRAFHAEELAIGVHREFIRGAAGGAHSDQAVAFAPQDGEGGLPH